MQIKMKLKAVIGAIKQLHASKEVETEIHEPEPEEIREPEIHIFGGFKIPMYPNGDGTFDIRCKDIPYEVLGDVSYWDAFFRFYGPHRIHMVFD